MTQKLKLLITAFLLVGVSSAVCLSVTKVEAAAIIEVNSTADDEDNDGECTLREAITAANNDTASGAAAGECIAGDGIDTINFAITGTADFTNGGQNGYTIEPQSNLPDITETVTINGYSQSGALANTAEAPQPLNGRLLIQLDGTSAGSTNGLTVAANDSAFRGLIVSNFEAQGVGVAADDIQVQGNYLGTNPAGDSAEGNAFNGVGQAADYSTNLL